MAGIALTACGGTSAVSSTSTTGGLVTTTTSAATTTTAAPATTTTAAPTTTTVATDYGQQFLTDMAPWNTATKAITPTDGITSQAVITAGQEAVVSARSLLQQSWPSNAQADIHTFAVSLDTINEDVRDDNLSKFDSDVTTLDADANVVRADLGLPAIK
ncbi:MAG: hypothetical protein WAM97_03215 [Acidimicrobiales bacterium]